MVLGLFGKAKSENASAGQAKASTGAAPAPGGVIPGLMQDWQLTVDKIIEHAKTNHGHREVVTRSVAGPIVRTTYADIYNNAKRVSEGLLDRGIQPGDKIATLAWNTNEHMEAWYGAMCIGVVLHTANPRLFPEQIAWLLNHAEDKALFFDVTFLPIVEMIAPKLETVRTFVVFGDDSNVPADTKIPGLVSYASFLEGMTGAGVKWGGFDENTACGLCYTSGTTGNPKGVMYSHRSNTLMAMIALQGDGLGLGVRETMLPIVPMFHANAWALTFSAPASGTKLVMPGAKMDGQSIYELLDSEKVTMSAAVPTVWLMLKQYLEETGATLPHLKSVIIGGAAVPEAILRTFEDKYDVEVVHAWGMTETSPMGTICAMTPETAAMEREEQIKTKLKQGRTPFGVQAKVITPDGEDLPRDGKTSGHLVVSGPCIAKAYYKGDGGEILDDQGFFDTGDVANIDELGFMQITDRSKDVIKSGGEWISSMDLENFAVGHPAVANAGAIGIFHPKWDERPLLVVQLVEGKTATKEEILAQLDGKIAKWWMPDDVAFVDEIPLGATGKINKLKLREMFKDYKLPTA